MSDSRVAVVMTFCSLDGEFMKAIELLKQQLLTHGFETWQKEQQDA